MDMMRCMVLKEDYEANVVQPLLPEHIFGPGTPVRTQEGIIVDEVEHKGRTFYVMDFVLEQELDMSKIKSGCYQK